MNTTRRILFCLAASALALASVPNMAAAQSRAFDVQRGRVSFVSEAPLENINGRSGRATGNFTLDPANVSATRGTVTVPVASLRTGIDLRDEHLRSDTWLNAGAHPNSTFEITGVSGADSLTANEDARVRITGNFTINGVSRQVTARARIKWDGADRVRVRCRFKINLSDFNVSIPAVVRLKVSNEIRITVDIRGSVAS